MQKWIVVPVAVVHSPAVLILPRSALEERTQKYVKALLEQADNDCDDDDDDDEVSRMMTRQEVESGNQYTRQTLLSFGRELESNSSS